MYPLEPTASQMREMGETALDYLVGFVEGLPEAPAANAEGGREVAERIMGSPPEEGEPFRRSFDLFAAAAEHSYEPAGPGYLAFIPGGGLYASALASFLAAGVNRFVNLAATAPGLVQIEQDVLRWLGDLFGFPREARGILTTGGSLANFSAVVTARTALLPEEFHEGVLYTSEQAHASVPKAAWLAGFPEANVRRVAVTPRLRMDLDALGEAIRDDRARGRRPFLVVASAGTTNTGAIDPLDAIADVCAEEGLWFHADAAYGGFFRLTDRGRERFRGIERADSITLDPHKGMFLPYGTGSLVVRAGERLRDAHFAGGHVYLQDVVTGDEALPNFSEYSPELSRDFRGLRVWLPLRLHGVRAFREALDEKLDLTELLDAELRATPGFELPWEPELSIVAFRYRPRSGDPEAFNRRLLERINASKRVFLSSTMIDGRFTIRACILSHRTHRDRVEEAADIIRRAAADLDA